MKQTSRVIWFLFLLLALQLSGCSKEEDGYLYEQVSPVQEDIHYYGNLSVTTVVMHSGSAVLCRMSLSDVLVGVHLLTATQQVYDFDLRLADSYARGSLTFFRGNAMQVSKVSGDFEYSAADNNQSFRFKGDIIYWFEGEDARNTQYGKTILKQNRYGRIDLF